VWQLRDGALLAGPTRRSFDGHRRGAPRHTLMLAGRLAHGPFGWDGVFRDLSQRIAHGFRLHRWPDSGPRWAPKRLADALAAFLREGLVPPPAEPRAHRRGVRGRDIFAADDVGCAHCHDPLRDYGDGRRTELNGSHEAFRTPPLLYVGGTPPFFHDGRVATLKELVHGIGSSMGTTDHLSDRDLDALAAFLTTIGTTREPDEEQSPIATLPFPSRRILVDSAIEPTTVTLDPPPDGVTPTPTAEEWREAERRTLPHLPDRCRLFRVREWHRIRCVHAWDGVARAATVVGSPDDVFLGPEIVFALRRGDRRHLELDRYIPTGYRGASTSAIYAISAIWLHDRPDPDIVITRYADRNS
jgi:mono/diheme cytochrome c family protein